MLKSQNPVQTSSIHQSEIVIPKSSINPDPPVAISLVLPADRQLALCHRIDVRQASKLKWRWPLGGHVGDELLGRHPVLRSLVLRRYAPTMDTLLSARDRRFAVHGWTDLYVLGS